MVEKQEKMVTVYTEQSIKEQEQACTAHHNQHENSNWIMPYLVQKNKND